MIKNLPLKYLLFLFCLVLGNNKSVKAQTKQIEALISYGFKFGLGSSRIFAEDFDNRNPASINTKPLIGNNYNLTLEIHSPLARKSPNIIFELGQAQKGWTEVNGEDTFTNQSTYYQLGILSKILIRKKKFNPYILAGIYAAYRTDIKKSIVGNPLKIYELFDSDPKGDYGINVGGGFEYKIKKVIIVADIRYVFGFQPILAKNNPTTPGFVQNAQTVFSFGIAYVAHLVKN